VAAGDVDEAMVRAVRALFLVSRLPYPPWRGDQLRAYHLLRVLAPRHEITCAVLSLRAPAPDAVAAVRRLGVAVEVLPLGLAGAGPALLRGALGDRPLQVALYERRRAKRRLLGLAGEGHFDLVHAQLVRTVPYAQLAAGAGPLVVDLVDALSLGGRRRAGRLRGPARWAWRREAERLQAYEASVLAGCAVVTVVAPGDAAALSHPGAPVGWARVEVVPNGVEIALPPPAVRPVPGRLVFAGNLGYFPNADAARWLARDIFPQVRAAQPSAHLRLVGARPARAVRRLAALPGVALAADVADIGREVGQAAVVVVPMRTGAGLQNKVLEALAAARPVVTTPMVAAALGLVDGAHALVAGDAAGLAEATGRLLADEVLAARLGRQGHAFVAARYTWDAAGARLDALWRHAVAATDV
jgi:sugar transferase (PEP-CTERM/EpsH1 system associated)